MTIKIQVPIRFTDPAGRSAWVEMATLEVSGTQEEVEQARKEFMKEVDERFRR